MRSEMLEAKVKANAIGYTTGALSLPTTMQEATVERNVTTCSCNAGISACEKGSQRQ